MREQAKKVADLARQGNVSLADAIRKAEANSGGKAIRAEFRAGGMGRGMRGAPGGEAAPKTPRVAESGDTVLICMVTCVTADGKVMTVRVDSKGNVTDSREAGKGPGAGAGDDMNDSGMPRHEPGMPGHEPGVPGHAPGTPPPGNPTEPVNPQPPNQPRTP